MRRDPKDYAEADDGIVSHSPGSVRAVADGASLIQVEFGASKAVLALLWLSSFISAIAIIGFIGVTMIHVRDQDDLSARIYVLEYDLAQMRAQLIEKEILDRTGH